MLWSPGSDLLRKENTSHLRIKKTHELRQMYDFGHRPGGGGDEPPMHGPREVIAENPATDDPSDMPESAFDEFKA